MLNSNTAVPLFPLSKSSWQLLSHVPTDRLRLTKTQPRQRQRSQAMRKCGCFARCFAAERMFSRAVGRAARQEKLAIRRRARTSGIRCSVEKQGVQEVLEKQTV